MLCLSGFELYFRWVPLKSKGKCRVSSALKSTPWGKIKPTSRNFISGKVKCNYFLFYTKFQQRWVQLDSCFITD